MIRRLHQIAAIFFIGVAIFLGLSAVELQYYTPIGPGPGFFPVWLCILMGALAAAHLIKVTSTPSETPPDGFVGTRQSYLQMAGVMILLAGLAALMPLIGFRLAMFAFFLAVLPLLGRRRPIEVLAVALVGSFGMYHALTRYLSLPLPIGSFGF